MLARKLKMLRGTHRHLVVRCA